MLMINFFGIIISDEPFQSYRANCNQKKRLGTPAVKYSLFNIFS